MFGIGAGEFVVIAVVLLLAVGPEKMPTFFRTVGRGLRAFRRTSRELKNAIGINELLRDDDFAVPPRRVAPKPSQTALGGGAVASSPAQQLALTNEELEEEHPEMGVDRPSIVPPPESPGEQ